MRTLVEGGGPFIGERRPCTRVTVEPGWKLNLNHVVATDEPEKRPYRWWQRADNSQVEVEIPNIRSVSMDRSMDTDAASCTIILDNTVLKADLASTDLVAGVLGDPGHFNPERANPESAAEWGISANAWDGLLDVNACIRTYMGYGGHHKTITQAVTDGDLVLKGVWLVDDVLPGPKAGTLTLECRDMFKLILDQVIYRPFMPSHAKYPLRYCRWLYTRLLHAKILEYDSTHPTHVGADGWWKYVTDLAMHPNGKGYWILGSDGGVFSYGRVAFWGSMGDGGLSAPAVGLEPERLGNGYWMVTSSGRIHTFGFAEYHGQLTGTPPSPIRRIRRTKSGKGYWLMAESGAIYTFGDAVYYGGNPTTAHPIVDMRVTRTGKGYWLLNAAGQTYTYGDAGFLGNVDVPAGETAVGLALNPLFTGYWVATDKGTILTGNDARLHRHNGPTKEVPSPLNDPICAIDSTPTGRGYLLVGGDGGIFSFGDGGFWGSLPGAGAYELKDPGDYLDFTDIVQDLLLWAGFLLQGTGSDDVYGNLESTGTYAEECLAADLFDKRFVIDPLTEIKNIVGYVLWCDEQGAARFHSPNWWSYGNILDDGTHTNTIPILDATKTLIDWTPRRRGDTLRSEIIISSSDPTVGMEGTVTTTFKPPDRAQLKGMVRPFMWFNGYFTSADEQSTMAELVAMHQFFAQYTSIATVPFHPAIEPDDQVWVYERSTGEARVHYVRGVSVSHELDSGRMSMRLTTNRLGTPGEWAIQ
jgi:hypothetical protein